MEKDLIEYIAKSLVDDPDAVSVTETEGDRGSVIQLKVADSDIGKVIGKYGRIAKALRTVLSASAVRDGKRYSLEILD
ncbi:KH domain-containing protein [Treponema parvum]|uniref:RNA-binding protein KhpA n=1 Tax=Treponema parvum TaxID=138851 RepID=A0A975F5N8_9SPIR|nr:KH domain-containing protein [Treponema parvum]QTQ11457.1 KH domain-containing protein [Treponema parvum]QTQ15169.1 KH domain-containing protein [Treponema parvum]QTQ16599.1 KH domain-containing protein [Treponema parvum]